MYGRYAALRDDHEKNGEAYAYFVPKDFLVPTATGYQSRADELAERAQERFEIRAAGPGLGGPRWYEWAMIEAGTPQHVLLIRRPLLSPGKPTTTNTPGTNPHSPDKTSYVYCYVPKESPIRLTLSHLVLMAGRRWPVEETIATGKGTLGWDHNQYRTWTSAQHHTALCGLAMLKATALRARIETTTVFPTDTTPPPTKNILNPQTDASPPPPDQPPQTHDDLIIPPLVTA